jgi:hypothetical protein
MDITRNRSGGSLRRDALILFSGMWLLYGGGINSLDLKAYALQHMVVNQLVDRGTYDLTGAVVMHGRDLLTVDGHILPNKQPGQSTLGAAVYWLLHLCGITYGRHFMLAGALVTWLTASFLSALAAACVFLLITGTWGAPRRDGVAAVLAGGLGTVLWPYSGVAHHDVIAGSYIAIAFCLIERAIAAQRDEGRLAAAGGALMGLALFTSGLPTALVAGIALYVVSTRRIGLILKTGAGIVAGVLPLAVYNAHYFGSPFLQGYVAGGFEDTYPHLDPARFLHNLNVYFGTGDVSVLKYMPIFVVAAAGHALRGALPSRPHRALLLILLLHVISIASIPSIGACQYGPRFLIPAVPLAMLGLPVLLARARQMRSPLMLAVVATAAGWSFVVNLTGVLGGSMYCDTQIFAFPIYVQRIFSSGTGNFPLLGFCAGIGLAAGALFLLQRRGRRSGKAG